MSVGEQLAREKSLAPKCLVIQREFARHLNGFFKMTFAGSSHSHPSQPSAVSVSHAPPRKLWRSCRHLAEHRVLARPLGRSIAQASDADAASSGLLEIFL